MESQKTTEEFMVPLYHVELVRDRMISDRSVVNAVAAAEVFHEMLDFLRSRRWPSFIATPA